MATMWVIVTVMRVAGNKEGNGDGGKSNGDSNKGGGQAMATRTMVTACQTYQVSLETEIRFPWRQKGFPPRSVFRSTNSHKISYDLHIQETRREGSLPPPLVITDSRIQHETTYPLDE